MDSHEKRTRRLTRNEATRQANKSKPIATIRGNGGFQAMTPRDPLAELKATMDTETLFHFLNLTT